MPKHEIVCITRQGFNLKNTEGADFAAKVTYLEYTPGTVYDPSVGVKQEMLIQKFGCWE